MSDFAFFLLVAGAVVYFVARPRTLGEIAAPEQTMRNVMGQAVPYRGTGFSGTSDSNEVHGGTGNPAMRLQSDVYNDVRQRYVASLFSQ